MQLPADVRARIEAEAEGLPFPDLRRSVELLSERYRSGASTRDLKLPPAFRNAAYLLTRFPATYAACDAVMREAAERLPECTSLLDLGAGSGAATLAALAHLPLTEAVCVERDAEFARIGTELLPRARWLRSDFTTLDPIPAHDLIVISYALGELPAAEGIRLAAAAFAACRVGLAIIEPGTPRGFKLIESMRKLGRIAAPCPSEAPCPMSGGDWCHFAARVERSSLHRRLKGGTLGHEDEKFSYVILSKPEPRPAAARVVRHPQQRPGLIQLKLCTAAGVVDRNVPRGQKDAFRAARKIEWGEEWTL